MKNVEEMMVEQLEKDLEEVKFWIIRNDKEMVEHSMTTWNTNREFVQRITGKKYTFKNWKVVEQQ